MRAVLLRHPSTRHSLLHDVSVDVTRSSDGGIALAFRLTGDIRRVRVPAPGTPRRVDGLWRHTCAEAFVMAGDGPAYREFNFAPSGEWAAYAFHSYRERAADAITLAPRIVVWANDEQLDLEVAIPADTLPRTAKDAPLRLGLAVVVEDAGGALSYWALRHLSDVPDFHHADAFAFILGS